MLGQKRRILSVPAVACLLACLFLGPAQGEELEPTELSTKAWVALKAGNHKEVSVLTEQCFKEFGEEAEKQQSENKEQITKDNASDFPELNSVGICLFILGQSLAEQGDKELSEAVFAKLIENYPDCHCENKQGYYWKPAKAANKKLTELSENTTK
jgi:4-diphosphocytidyl-2C-methyl-D-erythritol kinase